MQTCHWMFISLTIALLQFVRASVEEGETLISFKEQLMKSSSLESWIEGTDPCKNNWLGINCTLNRISTVDLSNKQLQGSLTEDMFLRLSNLTKLILGNNSFFGRIPQSLYQLSYLNYLDLSYNNFVGPLSTNFEKLSNLRLLSLTGNPLNSELSLDFSRLSLLQFILLAGCGLSGKFPVISGLNRLEVLDIEDNGIAGNIPDAIWHLPKLTVLAIQGNPLAVRYVIVATSITAINLRYLSVPENVKRKLPKELKKLLPSLRNEICVYVEWVKCSNNTRSHRLSKALIAGIVAAATIVGLFLFAVIIWLIFRQLNTHIIRKKKISTARLNVHIPTISLSPSSSWELQTALSPSSSSSSSSSLAHVFTYNDLKIATNNFSQMNLIGEGSFGQVFRGVLTSGRVVAVKKMGEILMRSNHGEREFRIEVDILTRLSHPNLIRLLGYCADAKHRLIVYEYMPNGSLLDYLEGRNRIGLDLRRRLIIALGSAKALAYMHGGGNNGYPVIHRDFKASNILLDKDFSPRVSDFGFAKLVDDLDKSHASTRVIGTFGYLDPHYSATGHLTVKSDVYGFGVVLLQLLTGKGAVVSTVNGNPEPILSWVGKKYDDDDCSVGLTYCVCGPYLKEKRKLKKVLDKELGSYPSKCAYRLGILAKCCLKENAEARPSMFECVQLIQNILMDCLMYLENISTQ